MAPDTKSYELKGSTGAGARPPRKTSFRPDVQGLRAFAVLVVVLYHAGLPVPGGFIGVDVFFVISGFVITGLLQRERVATGRVRLLTFYRRRVRRLLPAAAVMILLVLAACALFMSPLGTTQKDAGSAASAASVFLANYYFWRYTGGYFDANVATNPFLHTWSLSVEEQFYAGFPLLMILLWGLSARLRRPRLVMILLGTALAGSLVLSIALSYNLTLGVGGSLLTSKSLPLAFYSPFTRAWEFLAGAMLSVALRKRVVPTTPATIMSWLGAAFLIAAVFIINDTDVFPGVLALIPVVGSALLIAGGTTTQPGVLTRLLGRTGPVALGNLSYSWYLWHWPVIVFALMWWPDRWWVGGIAAAVSLLPAIASHRWVEQPIHSGRRLVGRRATALLAIVGIALPFAAGLGLVYAWQHNWWQPRIAAVQAQISPRHADEMRGCSLIQPDLTAIKPSCHWQVPNAKGTVLLIGDSNAGHLVEPMVAATQAAGLNLDVVTSGGCPFVVLPQYPRPQCQRFVEDALAQLSQPDSKYAAVVVSNSYSYPLAAPQLFATAGEPPSQDQNASIRAWARGNAAVVSAVSAHTPVLFVQAIPHVPAQNSYPQCLIRTFYSPLDQNCGTIPAAVVRTERDRVVSAVDQALSGTTHESIDLSALVCTPDRTCSAYGSNGADYKDPAHLSVPGSEQLTESFTTALKAATGQS